MALLNLCMKSDFFFFFGQKILLKHYENDNKKIFITRPRVCQIQDLCTKKKQKTGFSEKALTRIEKLHFILGSYESLNWLEG